MTAPVQRHRSPSRDNRRPAMHRRTSARRQGTPTPMLQAACSRRKSMSTRLDSAWYREKTCGGSRALAVEAPDQTRKRDDSHDRARYGTRSGGGVGRSRQPITAAFISHRMRLRTAAGDGPDIRAGFPRQTDSTRHPLRGRGQQRCECADHHAGAHRTVEAADRARSPPGRGHGHRHRSGREERPRWPYPAAHVESLHQRADHLRKASLRSAHRPGADHPRDDLAACDRRASVAARARHPRTDRPGQSPPQADEHGQHRLAAGDLQLQHAGQGERGTHSLQTACQASSPSPGSA